MLTVLFGFLKAIPIKVYLILAGIAVCLILYWYVTSLRSSLAETKDELNRTQLHVVQVTEEKAQLEKNYVQILAIKIEHDKTLDALQESNKKLQDTLYRERKGKASLEALIAKDEKGRIEKLINTASKKVFRCIENSTSGMECKE